MASADLVVSGGGTMNREAAALGIPVVTIFAGKPAAIDQMLVNEGKMKQIKTPADLSEISLIKKPLNNSRQILQTRLHITKLILEDW